MRTTADKAHVAAITTFLSVILAAFGLGDMPPPETIAEAAKALGAAGGLALASWLGTYWKANRPKE